MGPVWVERSLDQVEEDRASGQPLSLDSPDNSEAGFLQERRRPVQMFSKKLLALSAVWPLPWLLAGDQAERARALLTCPPPTAATAVVWSSPRCTLQDLEAFLWLLSGDSGRLQAAFSKKTLGIPVPWDWQDPLAPEERGPGRPHIKGPQAGTSTRSGQGVMNEPRPGPLQLLGRQDLVASPHTHPAAILALFSEPTYGG